MFHLPIESLRPRHYAVYSDESGQTGHSHMVIGGVSTSLSRVKAICDQIDRIRSQSQFPGDSLQWKNITARKREDYDRLTELALHLIAEHIIDFTAVIIDQKAVKNKTFNEGDDETAFQKFLGELFLSYIRKYNRPPSVNCYHGQRSSKFELEHIRSILNARASKRRYNYMPFDRLEYLDPSVSQMHQINDFLVGIVSWHWNPGMRKNLASPKSLLAKQFQRELGYKLLSNETPVTAPHFDIWKLKLS